MSDDIIKTVNTLNTVKQLEQLLNERAQTNPFPTDGAGGGYFTVFYTPEDVEAVGHQYEHGDLCIYYDFVTDDLPKSDFDEWFAWYNDLFWSEDSLDHIMADLGYKQIFESDGSGGGLWYGGLVYRK